MKRTSFVNREKRIAYNFIPVSHGKSFATTSNSLTCSSHVDLLDIKTAIFGLGHKFQNVLLACLIGRLSKSYILCRFGAS